MARRINAYVCTTCETVIATIDRAEGVTPMFLRCTKPFCGGRMQSAGYPAELADLKLYTHEWYKPGEKELRRLSPGERQHVEDGGLLLRQVGFPNDGRPIFQGEMMICCVCGKTLKSHPRIESNWTGLDLDGIRFYICPDELPLKKGGREAFKDAYLKIFRHIMGEDGRIAEDAVIGFMEHRKVGSN